MTTSKSIWPFLTCSARSSMPTMSAPASLAASALAPWVKTATRTSLPVPLGITVAPRTTWSDLRGSTPRLIATSRDSLNLTVDSSESSATASSREYALFGSTFSRITFARLDNLAMIRDPPRLSPCYERCQRWCAPRRRDQPPLYPALWSWRSLRAARESRYQPSSCSAHQNQT